MHIAYRIIMSHFILFPFIFQAVLSLFLELPSLRKHVMRKGNSKRFSRGATLRKYSDVVIIPVIYISVHTVYTYDNIVWKQNLAGWKFISCLPLRSAKLFSFDYYSVTFLHIQRSCSFLVTKCLTVDWDGHEISNLILMWHFAKQCFVLMKSTIQSV